MYLTKDRNLYLVISREYALEKSSLDIARQAILGGIDILQMREKNIPRNELLLLGRQYAQACKESGVIFIVNDDPYLVSLVGADGLHLGQEDFESYTTEKLRRIIGNKIIGISTHSLEQFEKANKDDFDYISFGPVFPTKTKDYFIGTKDMDRVLGMARKPVFIIGGINKDNIDIILKHGAKNIALIRDIVQAPNITAAARFYKEKLVKSGGKDVGKN